MKKIMLIIAALVVSSTTQALIADKFNCSLEVKDLETKASTLQQKNFFIARLHLSASPAQDVRLTGSQITETLTLRTPKAEFIANLNFYYKHAIRIDPLGNPLEARQNTCIALTGNYCENSKRDSNFKTCGISKLICREQQNPFDPDKGWSSTGLISGVPTFNEQTLAPATATITDGNGKNVGMVIFSCQYMGTYQ